MKKVLLMLLVSAAFLLAGNRVHAQDYQSALGLKFGAYEDGISYKYFADKTISYEGVLGFRNHGAVFTGLYELNQTAFSVEGLKFYYGFGAHIGAEGKGYYDRFGGDNEYYNNGHLLLGADGIVGLEYIVPQSPIAISLDLNPRIELATGPFVDIAPAIGLKYVFK